MIETNIVRLQGGPDKNYRTSPHNIEAEQALLGALLVNNDAVERVADFLDTRHFHDGLHQRIYDIIIKLRRDGKSATPVTVKTFIPPQDVADIDVPRYLALLAAEATTIINAQDYARTIYDLAVRRSLIGIGEDIVNTAYDAPVDLSPRLQIEQAEKGLFELAETGRYDNGFQKFGQPLTRAIEMAANAFQRDGHLSGPSHSWVNPLPQGSRSGLIR